MSWKPEVNTAGDPEDAWSSNTLRFATKAECDQYLIDLAMRWTAVRDVRATECEDPVTHEIRDDEIRRLEEPANA
jgi:hypothetical protein